MVRIASFPCKKRIGWKTWYSAGIDGFQNTIDAWNLPVVRKVISWSSVRVLSRDGVHEVEDTDHLLLLVPPTFRWNKKDLAVIPGRGDYLVVGIDNAGDGFHDWKPGLTLKLELGQG
jgi:hypothetical protein